MPPGATQFVYITAVVVIVHVLPRAWASNHPDNPLAKAVMAIVG